jgi:hypothetical protein
MSKKIRYTDERLAMGERVTDFLPPPSALVKREPTTKVTLELTQSSLAFFKKTSQACTCPLSTHVTRSHRCVGQTI